MRRIVIGITVLLLVGCRPLASPPPAISGLMPTNPPPAAPPPEPAPAPPPREVAPPKDEVVHVEYHDEQVQLNTCNGESVMLSGEVRRETKTKAKESTIEEHVNGHLTGVGDQGNEYQFKLEITSKIGGEPLVMKLSDRELLVSKGSAPDQRVTVEISSPPFTFDMQTECTH